MRDFCPATHPQPENHQLYLLPAAPVLALPRKQLHHHVLILWDGTDWCSLPQALCCDEIYDAIPIRFHKRPEIASARPPISKWVRAILTMCLDHQVFVWEMHRLPLFPNDSRRIVT